MPVPVLVQAPQAEDKALTLREMEIAMIHKVLDKHGGDAKQSCYPARPANGTPGALLETVREEPHVRIRLIEWESIGQANSSEIGLPLPSRVM